MEVFIFYGDLDDLGEGYGRGGGGGRFGGAWGQNHGGLVDTIGCEIGSRPVHTGVVRGARHGWGSEIN